MAAVAGTWAPPPTLRPLLARILHLQRMVRAKHVFVWLAGFDVRRLYPWGERAVAYASYAAREGAWGDLPPAYAHVTPRASADPPWSADTECPVCMEAFEDGVYSEPWPSSKPRSRAPPGRWACGVHALCRTCDKAIQSAPHGTPMVDAARSAAPRAECSCSPDRDPDREHRSP